MNIPAQAIFVDRFNGERLVRIGRVEREFVARNAVAFGFVDAKGREYGARYSIDREVWEVDASSSSLCPIDMVEARVAESFVVYPHAMRDGSPFGAIPVRAHKRFASENEAVAYGEAYIVKARARAASK